LAARHHKATSSGARPPPLGNATSAAVASSSSVKSSNVSKNDKNTPPESLTLRLKKAETAVEVATARLKSIRTLVEREGGGVANQAEQSHSERELDRRRTLDQDRLGRRLWIVNHHALRSRLLKLPGSHAHSQWRREEPG
jgi:hypothetical protein